MNTPAGGASDLRRQRNDEAFGSRHQAASRLADHRVGLGLGSEYPKLVDQDECGLLARHRVVVGRDHLQHRLRRPVRDRPIVILHMKQVSQLFVGPHHVGGGLEAVLCHLDRRRDDQQFRR